jgi:4-amino-4-deoxy-L-arabinose transferase-like glycosyltransferase
MAHKPTLDRLHRVVFLALLALALFLRLWQIWDIPPGLWYDEALYCLNALSIGRGHWPIFFMLHDHPVEPLYVYTLAGAFALFGPTVVVGRIVSALWGTIAVALFYPIGRRLMNERWALVGCFVYAVFRWPLHFSRTIFRAVTPPVFIMLVVLFFLRWRERRRTSDAMLCGLFLGLGLYTYISFRLVPLLWLAWVVWLAWRGEIVWRRDAKALATMVITAFLVGSPLAVDFLFHPAHFSGRLDEVSMFHERIEQRRPDGRVEVHEVPKPLSQVILGLLRNAVAVSKMWTIRGDHVGRHNLPYEPVFDWVSGIIFYIGVLWAMCYAWRREAAFLPLLWLLTLLAASVFSFGAPNILRAQGAIPAVVLLYLRGLHITAAALQRWTSRRTAAAVSAILLLWFAVVQLDTYFRRFAVSPVVRNEFLTDTFYEPARAARLISSDVREVWVSRDLADHLTFQFVTYGLKNIRKYDVLGDALSSATPPAALMATTMVLQKQAQHGDPRELLARHKTRLQREFSVLAPTTEGQWTRVPFAYLWILPIDSASKEVR